MALSAFTDRTRPPEPAELRAVLGRAGDLWDALVSALRSDIGPLDEEWTHAGKNYGWSMRLKRKTRAIVYLTPRDSDFLASFALGERACRAAAQDASLLPPVLAIIDAAPRYAEGRGVRIPVRTRKDLAAVRRLAAIKVAN